MTLRFFSLPLSRAASTARRVPASADTRFEPVSMLRSSRGRSSGHDLSYNLSSEVSCPAFGSMDLGSPKGMGDNGDASLRLSRRQRPSLRVTTVPMLVRPVQRHSETNKRRAQETLNIPSTLVVMLDSRLKISFVRTLATQGPTPQSQVPRTRCTTAMHGPIPAQPRWSDDRRAEDRRARPRWTLDTKTQLKLVVDVVSPLSVAVLFRCPSPV